MNFFIFCLALSDGWLVLSRPYFVTSPDFLITLCKLLIRLLIVAGFKFCQASRKRIISRKRSSLDRTDFLKELPKAPDVFNRIEVRRTSRQATTLVCRVQVPERFLKELETEFLWHATGRRCLPSKPVRGRMTLILRQWKNVPLENSDISFGIHIILQDMKFRLSIFPYCHPKYITDYTGTVIGRQC